MCILKLEGLYVPHKLTHWLDGGEQLVVKMIYISFVKFVSLFLHFDKFETRDLFSQLERPWD